MASLQTVQHKWSVIMVTVKDYQLPWPTWLIIVRYITPQWNPYRPRLTQYFMLGLELWCSAEFIRCIGVCSAQGQLSIRNNETFALTLGINTRKESDLDHLVSRNTFRCRKYSKGTLGAFIWGGQSRKENPVLCHLVWPVHSGVPQMMYFYLFIQYLNYTLPLC